MAATGRQAPKSAARRFYQRALSRAERAALEEARQVEGVDEEIALLRLRLRRLLREQPEEVELLFKGVGLLLRAVATRYRLSPEAQDELAGSVATLLDHVTGAAAPEEERQHGA